eukprot:Phypoly_transcript_15384.p1 GENE.Phypoly_transcript_15384~~Phypoly_transcript_15384.p1  ORF type:complete len:285 (+),score=36.05 Phypoly_transcript_15384:34-888(+)
MKSKEGKPKNHNKKAGYRGDVPGCYIGQIWEKRQEMCECGMHGQSMAGIDGREDCGCYSIVLSAGYEDDVDNGDEIIYTGCGGQNPVTREQEKDQEFKGKNGSLVVSYENKYPVRVIRGFACPSGFAPESGYRYDGLYEVEKYWLEKLRGFNMCRFLLRRRPGQIPLPAPRENFKPKQKKRAALSKVPTAIRTDQNYLYTPVETSVLRAMDGFCVVCEKLVEGGCGYEHIEQHIKELWDSYDVADQQKVCKRAKINSERISAVIDALTTDTSISMPNSPVFVWP